MKFDIYGNLHPAQIITSDWATIEEIFVGEFPASSTRKKLFSNFSDYLFKLKQAIEVNFTVWIDGSFVTNKLNPRDIDFVIFVDYKIYQSNEVLIDQFRALRNVGDLGTDGYFVPVYPKEHENRFLFETDQIQWLYQFGRSRSDRMKGIIELNY